MSVGRRLLWILLTCLLPSMAAAQTVAQGQPAPTSDARAWPFKVVFGGAQIDPRDVSDRSGRLLGQVTFATAQPVSFTMPNEGQQTMANSISVAIASDQTLPLPSGASTAARQDTGNASLSFLTSVAQTVATSIGDIVWPAGGSDGTLWRRLKTDTAGELQVDVLTLPNVTLGAAIPAGTNNIGDVDVLSFPDNEPINIAQMNGVTVSMGVGASGTGTQRVASVIHDGTDTALVSSAGSLQVTCESGCSGGTTDTDDGSVAGSQSTGITINLSYLWNGSTWARVPGDATNGVKVQCTSGCTPGGSFSDNAAFTFGTTAINVSGFVFDDVATNAATENSAAAPRMSSNRVPYSQLRDAAGNERGANVNASNALLVAQTGALPAGTNNIGDVDILTIAAGDNNIGNVDIVTMPSVTIGTFPDNEPFNIAQVNGGTVTTVATGTQKVGIADSGGTAFLSAANALNSTGAGVQTAQIVGQFDDTSPTTITENQFGNLRMSTNRNLFGTIRDAAGNERGANVNASNELLVNAGTVTIGTFPDNEPFNVAQINGVTPLMGNGASGTGAQRVTIANDSTGVLATVTTVTTVTNLTNLPNEGQQTAANSISVTPDTDNDAIGATAAAVPGEAMLIAGTDGTNVTVPYIDPCQRKARTQYRVDIVTATTTEIAAAVASEFYWICSIQLQTDAANDVIIVEDDTATNCPSPTAGVSSGGTTSGEGWNFAAGSGIVVGVGSNWIMKSTTANRSICIITSAATQLSGTITYVSAP